MSKNNFFIVLFLTISYVCIGQTYLGYNLNTNDNFTLQQDVVQNITQEIQGINQEITNNLQATLYFSVKEKTDETITLDVSFTTFSMKMSSPQMGILMEIDTQSEKETPESKMFKGIINATITIIIDYRGKVLDIKNGDSFLDNMISGMEISDEAAIKEMRNQLQKDWSGESLGKSFEQVLFNYPNTKINTGASWTNSFEAKNGLNAKNTWTLNTVENNIYKISGSAEVVAKVDNVQITMSLSGTQETELTADANTGIPIKLTVISSTEGNSVSKVMPDFKIPTKIISTTTYTRL